MAIPLLEKDILNSRQILADRVYGSNPMSILLFLKKTRISWILTALLGS